ncbi:hypothetical protein OOK31_36230 [Streptomyces sp. NBC_00249]|uniref:hypothetical protein n=1 Tax=Streptomyces sp. NBC_00249 TaxID=2975690 RepID=UPI00225A5125|nr:hypothetical protein [Streptomyces sp. NBC_00249]MCX5199271.1 hypothetical protein [Streptomyces sp. NBC_00249]
MMRASGARVLYEALRTLEVKATSARRKSRASASRREVARLAGHAGLDRRIGEWIPEDSTRAKVPDPSSSEQLIAAVRVWSTWAGETLGERYWRDLLDQAQPGRAPRSGTRSGPDGAGSEDLYGVFRNHHAWIEQCVLPDRLFDREAELRELEGFCTAPDDAAPRYAWWQAGPWAGKSALMAELVLRHRPPGVDFVSCFIGDHLGNNDRDSFLQTVNPQLAVLAGQDPAASRHGGGQEFPGLFTAAAEVCRSRGRRLVLVVDGLDEDRGSGPDGLSIAALLPRVPPVGMRVIVAGRPNPPVPDGVHPEHPLRRAGIVRPLASSPFASDISARARQELHKLLGGAPLGRDVLGLVTVSEGGLTADDLAELVDAPPYEVDVLLRGVTGRSFLPGDGDGVRPPTPAHDGRQTQVLGHTELHREALTKLGRAAVIRYQAQLHGWADAYRAKGWPPDTPSYLLYDYPRMLRRADGSTGRLAELVLDPRRQQALLGRASVDTAVSEVELASRLVERDAADDLATRAALAVSREVLTHSARGLPSDIPVAFATLGQWQRAKDLALTSPYPDGKAVHLARVARALAGVDDERAVETAREAARWADRVRQESAPTNGDEHEAEVAAAEAAVALIAVGQEREGRDLLGTLRPYSVLGDSAFPCTTMAEAAGAARRRHPELAEELLDQAEVLAEEVLAGQHAESAAAVAAWSAIALAAGPPDSVRAARMYARISDYARTAPPGLRSVTAVANAALALAGVRPDEAAELARQAAGTLEAGLSSLHTEFRADRTYLHTDPDLMLTAVAYARVATGAVDDARRLVEGVSEDLGTGWFGRDVLAGARAALEGVPRGAGKTRAEVLAREARDLAEQGRAGEASRRLDEALEASVTIRRDSVWETKLVTLSAGLAAVGLPADGTRLARGLRSPTERARALAAVAIALADAGNLTLARPLAHEAADLARETRAERGRRIRHIPQNLFAGDETRAAAYALACAGEGERALELIAGLGKPDGSGRRYETVLVAAGLRRHDAVTAAELVEAELARIKTQGPDPSADIGPIVALGTLIAAIGDADDACGARLLQAVGEEWSAGRASEGRGLDCPDVLVVAVLEGEPQRPEALRLLDAWERDSRSVPPWELPTAGIALTYAALGDHDAARRVAAGHNAPDGRAEAYAAVAGYLVATPENAHLTSWGADTAFTKTLRSLAVSLLPPVTSGAAEQAHGFVAKALTDGGWHHALPALVRIAPQAVGRIRDIVFSHLHLEAEEAAGGPGPRH